MKKSIKAVALLLSAGFVLSACGTNEPTGSNDVSEDGSSAPIADSSDFYSSDIPTSSSSDLSAPVTNNLTWQKRVGSATHTIDDVYDAIERMASTKTFTQVLYGTDDIYTFTYHGLDYIAQDGGDIDYSAITLPNYKGDGKLVYLADFERLPDGHKSYSLGQAVPTYDENYQINGQLTTLEYNNPVTAYGYYDVRYKEVLAVDGEPNVFQAKYNNLWYTLGNGDNTFFAFVSILLNAAPYFSAARLPKIEFFWNEEDVFTIAAYLNNFENDDIIPYFISEFRDIGTAKDDDLEAFLASDAVKISADHLENSMVSNILGDSLSTKTTVSLHFEGQTSVVGEANLDYNESKGRYYGLNGNTWFHNGDGMIYEDYIDGLNEISSLSTGFPWSALTGLGSRFSAIDWRKTGENEYRYYGPKVDEAFGDVAELSLPSGFMIKDLFVTIGEQGAVSFRVETNKTVAKLEDGTVGTASYTLVTEVLPIRNIPDLTPYARNDVEASRLEAALAILNNRETEFRVHGEEHAEEPSLDSTSYREITYASDFVLEENDYYKTHGSADNVYESRHINEKTGYYLSEGGVTPFKVKDGNMVATTPIDSSKHSLSSYWYRATPSAEVFDYDPATRTYSSKEGVGYYAAIFVQKCFRSAADNYMHDVRFTLTEDLSRIAAVEYDCWVDIGDDLYEIFTGHMDFEYDIDVSATRAKLAAMPAWTEPTKWSDSAQADTIIEEFNDFYKGCVDCHGNPLNIDMVPYLFDSRGDYYWAPVQMTIVGELWMINDAGCANPNYVQEMLALFRANPDYTEAERPNRDGAYLFTNGDMTIEVYPNSADGLWFSKTANKFAA